MIRRLDLLGWLLYYLSPHLSLSRRAVVRSFRACTRRVAPPSLVCFSRGAAPCRSGDLNKPPKQAKLNRASLGSPSTWLLRERARALARAVVSLLCERLTAGREYFSVASPHDVVLVRACVQLRRVVVSTSCLSRV
jgi:hypothetical protein